MKNANLESALTVQRCGTKRSTLPALARRTVCVGLLAVCTLAQAGQNEAREGKGFVPELVTFLGSLAQQGLIGQGTAAEIEAGFRDYEARFPRVFDDRRFGFAIPTLKPFREPYAGFVSPELETAKRRPITEILSTDHVDASGIEELFRKVLAPKPADGTFHDLFVTETYAALVKAEKFRKPDGSVDQTAIDTAIASGDRAFGLWKKDFAQFREDGRMERLATAINGVIGYASERKLLLYPAQLRRGLASIGLCLKSKPDSAPSVFTTSNCALTMVWLGERPHPDAAMLVTYSPEEGRPSQEKVIAPWDREYANKVYRGAFGQVQATENDRYWKEYFKTYDLMAKAVASKISADDAKAVLEVSEVAVRAIRSLNAYVGGKELDGRRVGKEEARRAVEEATVARARLISLASPYTRSRTIYTKALAAVDGLVVRAKLVGIAVP